MSQEESRPNRRRFIAGVAGSAAALAAAGLAPQESLAQGQAAPYPPPQGGWDMSWVDRVERLKHRQVFDVPELSEGIVFANVSVYLRGFAEVYKTADADMGVVTVFRHMAVPAILNDDMWARLKIGERVKVKDPATGEFAVRNPYIRGRGEERPAAAPPSEAPAPGASPITILGIDTLVSRGFTVLCCNLALMQNVGRLARAESMSTDDARAAIINAVLPGVVRMPNGVFAVTRAQEAGCNFLRST